MIGSLSEQFSFGQHFRYESTRFGELLNPNELAAELRQFAATRITASALDLSRCFCQLIDDGKLLKLAVVALRIGFQPTTVSQTQP